MAFIIEVPNPFEPLKDIRKHEHEGGVSVRGWLEQAYPGFEEFPLPTICLVNGKALLREQWTYVIRAQDVVNFVTIPQGPLAIIVAVIAIAAIVLSIFFGPTIPGELPASDPVFSTKGQQNEIRLGEPIEVNYGRNRIYPSMAARPYFQYFDNDQYQFSLFCIGQGSYSISDIQIGDTTIDDYQEATYEVVEPGNDVTLFPTNVATSVEVGGLTLYAPNEDSYPVDGWVGPFFANASATDAIEIQVDLIFPKGLYGVDSKGRLYSKSITVEFQKREVDDAGSPLSGWTALLSPSPTTETGATTTPQRRTYSVVVTAGRYEIRARRTDTKDESYRAGHDVTWDGLRSYLVTSQDWGDVTLLAVKIRATANLNDRTRTRFNVIATRKLPIYESGGWSAPQATRSIVWAFADVFRSNYGARITDDSYIDIDSLLELDTLYTTRGENFDWTFRDPITVWEAARTIAQVGRAVPLLAGSLITMKRDTPSSVPVTLFIPDNMVGGSFQWNVKLWELDEYDSLELEYIDPDTDYKPEQVLATLPGGTTDNPKRVRLPGVQNRTHAYRQGLYMLAAEKYRRETIVFDTGMEGHIPTFGDLVAVCHDVPRWNQSGWVVHAVDVGYQIQLWVSEPLLFEESGTYVMLLRKADGSVLGPYTALETQDSDGMQVVLSTTDTIDFLFGGKNEPMLFLFGLSDQVTRYLKIARVEPQGKETIRITATNYATEVYGFDSLSPGALPTATWPDQAPDLPSITTLTLTQIEGVSTKVQASWTAASGAQYYILQTSEDGENWETKATTVTTSYVLDVRPGPLWVRVAGLNSGQGPWTEQTLTVESLLGVYILTPWADLDWGVTWWDVPNVYNYVIRVYDNETPSTPVLKRTVLQSTRQYDYDYATAVADSNLVRDMLVTVNTIYLDEGEVGTPVEQELTNSYPAAPTNPASAFITEDSNGAHYMLTWDPLEEDDLIRIKVWLEPVSGFDPDVATPVYDYTAPSPSALSIPTSFEATVPLETTGEHDQWYWRVGVFDVWGGATAAEGGISAEQVIPDYVP